MLVFLVAAGVEGGALAFERMEIREMDLDEAVSAIDGVGRSGPLKVRNHGCASGGDCGAIFVPGNLLGSDFDFGPDDADGAFGGEGDCGFEQCR